MADSQTPPDILCEYEHEGIRYLKIVLASSLKALKTFDVREEDVWVVTFPKSGTHWMLEIVGLILADGDPDNIDRSLMTTCAEMINLNQRFPTSKEDEEANPMDLTPFLDTIEKASSPRTIETHVGFHLLPQDLLKKAKVIYVARNPKDVATSWFNFLGKNPSNPVSWEEYLRDFMAGKTEWGPWFEEVYTFWKLRDHPNVLFVKYEDLIKEPAKYVAEIAKHIGRPLSDDMLKRVVTNSTMSVMKKSYQKLEEAGGKMLVKVAGQFPFLNTGVIGKWKSQFTVAQNEVFDEWYHSKTKDTDLRMAFE